MGSLLDRFPPYCHLFINHNQHNLSYESMSEYLDDGCIRDYVSFEDAHQCLVNGSIWEVQVYPRTPISFYKTVSYSFERALELMLQNCKGGEWV